MATSSPRKLSRNILTLQQEIRRLESIVIAYGDKWSNLWDILQKLRESGSITRDGWALIDDHIAHHKMEIFDPRLEATRKKAEEGT